MDYLEFDITITPFNTEVSEILIAELSQFGFESFTENPEGIKAYIPQKNYCASDVLQLLSAGRFKNVTLNYLETIIKAQNWNAVWESNFEPITIGNNLLVKAPFHNITGHFENSITIEPKMSFGTGHHATTSLILELMANYNFKNQTVLDMGCGTGILAIYAHLLGANYITAIDIDEWAYTNCIENFERNNCNGIVPILGDKTKIPNKKFNFILANINRNVLVSDIETYKNSIESNGYLFLSGFYISDIEVITNEAKKNNFRLICQKEKNDWAACVFTTTNV